MRVKPNKLKYKDNYTEIYHLADNGRCTIFITSTRTGYSIYKFDRYPNSCSVSSVFEIIIDNEASVKDNYELAKKKARETFPDMSRKPKA
jgi:hypothetical protein